jgi:amino acid transporter
MSRLKDYGELERNRRERIGVARWRVAWALILVGVAVLLFDLWGMFTFAFTFKEKIGELGWYGDTTWPAWLFVGGIAVWAIGNSIRHPDDYPTCPRCGHLFISSEVLSDHLKNDHADDVVPPSQG